MDTLLKAAAVGICAAVLGLVVKKAEPEQTLLLGILAAAVILAAVLTLFREAGGFLRELSRDAGISAALTGPVAKSVGIAIAGKLAADVCKDAGQNAVSSALELATAAAVVCAALPLLRTLATTVFRLT